MIIKIREFVNEVKNNHRLNNYDEAQTKQALILPLLQLLGWNPFDIEEVMPEFLVENRRIDFCLKIQDSKFFVEVKKPGEDLERHEKQLLDYSFRAGVPLAALTNGITWWFYLPTQEGKWHERKFYAIDILQQDSSEVASKFIDLLSKENVKSNQAFSNAVELYKSRRREEKLNKAIPEAWDKIIGESDPLLVELLTETAEKLCGFRPDASVVSNFLNRKKESLSENLRQIKDIPRKKTVRKSSFKTTEKRSDRIEPRRLGKIGNEQIGDYIIPVIKFLKSGMNHTEVFHKVANDLGVLYSTVSAQCRIPFGINTKEFLEYVENGKIIQILENKYPTEREKLKRELGSFYNRNY